MTLLLFWTKYLPWPPSLFTSPVKDNKKILLLACPHRKVYWTLPPATQEWVTARPRTAQGHPARATATGESDGALQQWKQHGAEAAGGAGGGSVGSPALQQPTGYRPSPPGTPTARPPCAASPVALPAACGESRLRGWGLTAVSLPQSSGLRFPLRPAVRFGCNSPTIQMGQKSSMSISRGSLLRYSSGSGPDSS